VHGEVLAAQRTVAVAAVDDYHAANPLRPGISREELRSKLPPQMSPKLFHLVVESLVSDAQLAADRDVVRRPGHSVAATQQTTGMAPLAERVAALYRDAALTPPRLPEAVTALATDASKVKEAVDLLTREGTLVKVQDLHFHRAAVEVLRAKLVAFLKERKQITAQEWKDLVGATRKFSIPLAEHFDAEKLTLRVGEVRKLRG
jgi:selenocysteine-specific elongation factor